MDMIDQQRVFEMLPISKEQRLALIEAIVKEHEADDLNSEQKEKSSDDTMKCSPCLLIQLIPALDSSSKSLSRSSKSIHHTLTCFLKLAVKPRQ